MAHRKADLVQETSTSTGTGAMALAGAASGKRAFSAALSNADTCYVLIQNGSAPSEYEICLATYNSSGNTLTRGTVVGSTTGSTVNFSAGTKTISLVAPASKMLVEDNNGDASVTRNATIGGKLGLNGASPDATAAINFGTTLGFKGIHVYDDGTGISGLGVSANTLNIYSGGTTIAFGNAALKAGSGSMTELARLNSTGLGIGRSPNAKLDVAGSVTVSDSAYVYTGFNGATWTGAIRSGVQFDGTNQNLNFYTAAVWRGGVDSSGNWRPGSDNAATIGAASFRFSVVYAGTGTINTSGRDTKIGIRAATDAEKRAARRILDGGPKLYKFRDAVDAKGEAARLHAGYIAEDVQAALEAEGLDPWLYGFLCADEITTVEEYTVTVEQPKMRKVETTERAVELIDGQPVLVTRTVERDEPVGQMRPVVDRDGQPVLVPGGEPDAEGNVPLIPMLHFVPEVEQVEETRTREVKTGETRLGLRYSELEAFLRCATGV